jgi:hypothetical protein
MAFLIGKFWVPLLVAGLLGLYVGWATCSRAQTSARNSWIPWGIVAVVGALFAALLMLLPGRPGFGRLLCQLLPEQPDDWSARRSRA